MSLPLPESSAPRPRPVPELRSAADLAADGLGRQDDLAVIRKTTRDLADYYLERAGIAAAEPHQQVTANYLAIVLRNQLKLLATIEEELHQMVLDHTADSFDDALLRVTMNGSHKKLHGEVKRLHNLAMQLRRELEDEAPSQGQSEGT